MEHLKLFLITASFLFPLALSIAFMVDARKNVSRVIMTVVLLNTSFIFLCTYLYFQEDYSTYYPLHSLNSAVQLSIFPLIYLYIRSVVSPTRSKKLGLLHLIPGFIMFFVASYIFYVYTNYDDLVFFLKHNRMGFHFEEFKFTVLKVSRYIHLSLLTLQGLLYSMVFIRIPDEFDRKLRNEFSNIESFSINWMNKYLLWFALVITGGFFAYAFLPLKGYSDLLIKFMFFLFSAFVCRLGVLALKQQAIEVNLDEILHEIEKPTQTTPKKDKQLIKKLNDYMHKNKAFLQRDITLTVLATELGTNRTYLSMLINQEYGVNFSTYINQQRLNFAEEHIKMNPNINKDELSQLAGFGSKSTMMRALSKNTMAN